jgi:hypothetical protein
MSEIRISEYLHKVNMARMANIVKNNLINFTYNYIHCHHSLFTSVNLCGTAGVVMSLYLFYMQDELCLKVRKKTWI